AGLVAARTPVVLATVVAAYRPQSAHAGAKAIVHADGTVEGWFGGGCVRPIVVREALDALESGTPRLVRFDVDVEAHSRELPGIKSYPMACQGEGGLEIYLEPMAPRQALVVI